MTQKLVLNCLDELVADMVVDPDATHTQSEHTQRVLVIVGQRPVGDCKREWRTKKKKKKETKL